MLRTGCSNGRASTTCAMCAYYLRNLCTLCSNCHRQQFRTDYEALQARLHTLPDKLTHDVMVRTLKTGVHCLLGILVVSSIIRLCIQRSTYDNGLCNAVITIRLMKLTIIPLWFDYDCPPSPTCACMPCVYIGALWEVCLYARAALPFQWSISATGRQLVCQEICSTGYWYSWTAKSLWVCLFSALQSSV